MQDQVGQKKMKVKKGSLTVIVGLDEDNNDKQRFVIPIAYLHHPLFHNLLEKAREAYGYHTSGPLRLPCLVEDFHHILWKIEKETNKANSHQRNHSSLSFNSC